MPHALLLTLDFPPSVGGIQEFLFQFCQNVHRLEPEVIAPWHRDAPAFDATLPYLIHRTRPPLAYPVSHLAPMLAQALGACSARRPDLIVCGHINTAPIGLLLSRLLHVPFVVFGYAMELKAPRSVRLGGPAARRADLFVAISRYAAQAVERFGVRRERIHVTPLGVDPSLVTTADALTPCPSGEDLTASLAPTRGEGRGGRPMLLTVARLQDRYKGHDNVIRALPLIAAKVPEVRYVVAGDGPLRQYLERLAVSLDVRERVEFRGRVSDVERRELYQSCEVFVMPSRESRTGGGAEGFGIVYLEANAAGKPVVGGRSGGIPDAVLEGQTGLLVEPNDIADIAEACTRLLTDRELAARLGRQGYERVATQLTWPKVIAELEERLLKLLPRGETRSLPIGADQYVS